MPAVIKDQSLEIKRYEGVTDKRLGRHVVHDPRSRRFAAPRKALGTLKTIEHTVNLPVLDQGNLGACTGYSGTNVIGSTHFWQTSAPVLQRDASAYAVSLYSDATKIDPWEGAYEPIDTGSDGLSVAKVLKERGLISGYQHAFSLEACLTALAERVVTIGTNWYSGMFTPTADGQLRVTGQIEGGHQWTLIALDVERKRVRMLQSWGPAWGQKGTAWLTWNDLGRLLSEDGDCTCFVPREEPAPQPAPAPAPGPGSEVVLATAWAKFVKTKSCPAYVRKPTLEWLKGH